MQILNSHQPMHMVIKVQRLYVQVVLLETIINIGNDFIADILWSIHKKTAVHCYTRKGIL